MITKPTTLQSALIVTGGFAFMLSLVAGLQFYVTLGHSILGQIVYGVAGALLTAIAVLLLPVCILLFMRGAPIAGALFGLVWVGLTALAIFAEVGFFANQQADKEAARAAAGLPAQLAQSEYEAAAARAAQLEAASSQALVAQAQGELARLQTKMDNAMADSTPYMLPDCTPKRDRNGLPYTSRAADYCGQVQALRLQMEPHQKILDNAAAYQGAQQAKTAALAALAAATSGGAGVPAAGMNPAYTWAERLTGIEARTAQTVTSAAIALVIELWASLSAFLLARLFGIDGTGVGGNSHHDQIKTIVTEVLTQQQAKPHSGEQPQQKEPRRRVGFVNAAGIDGAAWISDGQTAKIGDVKPLGFTGFIPPAYNAGVHTPAYIHQRTYASVHTPAYNAGIHATSEIPRGVERYAGTGKRIGKVDTCQAAGCGGDYIVTSPNRRHCDACSKANRARYSKSMARKGRS